MQHPNCRSTGLAQAHALALVLAVLSLVVPHWAQAADAVTRSFVGQTVAAMEKTLILDTLTHCLGNRTHAANILGISIRTLRNKLREYSQAGIRVAQPGDGRAA